MRTLPALCAVLLLGVTTPAALATDVVFTGLVANTCVLAVPTPGVMRLNDAGDVLGSDQLLGVPATVTIVSIGANTITLDEPELVSHPPGYSEANQTLKINYTGLANHPLFSSTGLDFVVGLLPISELFVNLRIENPDGFAQGSYTARTVLTCS
jgi:hypothetical protein